MRWTDLCIYMYLFIANINNILGVLTHIFNPSTEKFEVKNCEFEASLSYVVRLCLKINKQN